MKEKIYDIGETFNFPQIQGASVMGYEAGSVNVPKIEPRYQFDIDVLRDLLIWWNMVREGKTNDGMYLFGPTGAGKSSAFVNFCARLNIPLYEKTIYEGMEFDVLMGSTEIVGGDTVFCYGVVPLAMGVTNEPGILLLNEIDRADDAVLTGLYEVLAGRPLVLDAGGHDVIEPQHGFCFASTGNTSMAGADDNYINAKKQDLAFVDRFIKVKIDYLPAEVETEILRASSPLLEDDVCVKMVELANAVRSLHTEGDNRIPFTLSTRGLLRWAALTSEYLPIPALSQPPLMYALDRSLLNTADPVSRAAIMTHVDLLFGESMSGNAQA